MKFQRRGPSGAGQPVVETADGVIDLRPIWSDIGPEFFAGDGPDQARAALRPDRLPQLDVLPDLVGPPMTAPGRIISVGLNYRDQAAEAGAAISSEPIVFMKDPSTVVCPHDDILLPPTGVKTNWEVELGGVIGRTARYLPDVTVARDVVAGYVVSHDVSEGKYQLERGGRWDKGTSCKTFNPLGPDLVPADDVDPGSLGLRLWVNGEQRQDATTADLIFDGHHVVWYLSQFMVLRPGDLINTGTPAGVALGLPDNPCPTEGDVVVLEIDGLGRQRSACVRATVAA